MKYYVYALYLLYALSNSLMNLLLRYMITSVIFESRCACHLTAAARAAMNIIMIIKTIPLWVQKLDVILREIDDEFSNSQMSWLNRSSNNSFTYKLSYLRSVGNIFKYITIGKTDTNTEKHNKSIRISLFNNKAIA